MSPIRSRVRFAALTALALAACAAFSAAARADWSLTAADLKEPAKVTVNTWSLKEGLSYTPQAGEESGKLQKLPSRQVVSLVSDRSPATPVGKWTLTLRNGDVLDGEPAAPAVMGKNNLIFKVSGIDATVEVPIKLVAWLQAKDAKAPAAAGPAGKDTARLKNTGDLIEGDFLGVLAEADGTLKVQMGTDAGERTLELSKIDRIAIAGVTPARAIPPLSARITLLSGTTLTTPDFDWSINVVSFKDPAGKEIKTTAEQILSLEILGGRTVFLTELDPAKDQQTSLFASKWPTQINKNVLGGPLKVGKTPFARGLGVHVKSILSYDLDGSFENLTLRAGLDDSSAPYGQANLSVVLDGKVLWEKKGMKAGEISDLLVLPIKGGKHLELRAEPADRLDVQGRVDWVNVALTRS